METKWRSAACHRDFCGEASCPIPSRDTVHVSCTVFIRPDHWDHSYLASSSSKETPIIHAKRFQTVWICSSSREVRQMENELPVRGVRPRRWGSQTMISFGVTWSTGATSSLEWWSRRSDFIKGIQCSKDRIAVILSNERKILREIFMFNIHVRRISFFSILDGRKISKFRSYYLNSRYEAFWFGEQELLENKTFEKKNYN